MPANNRSAARNVHVYDAEKPSEEELSGLVLTNGVTNKNLYAMINIIVMIDGPYSLRHNSSDTIVPEDDAPLQPGNYYIVTTGKFLSMILL